MISLKFLLLATISLFAFASTVFAFSGSHSFTNATTISSTGHSYSSSYVVSGSFPYNGRGSYDGNKVNLVGTYTLYFVDGSSVNEQYCVKTTGSINSNGRGKLTAKVYQDTGCTAYKETKSLTVKNYTEDGSGNFTLVTTDGSGVMYTTTGAHSF